MAAASTHFDILVAVAGAIKALALEGVPANQVVLRKAPYGADLQKPALIVSPGDSEDLYGPASTFRARHEGYPVRVTYVPGSPEQGGLTAAELAWREAVINHFAGTETTPPATVNAAGRDWRAQVEGGPVIDPDLWQRTGWFVGSVLLRFYAMV